MSVFNEFKFINTSDSKLWMSINLKKKLKSIFIQIRELS